MCVNLVSVTIKEPIKVNLNISFPIKDLVFSQRYVSFLIYGYDYFLLKNINCSSRIYIIEH